MGTDRCARTTLVNRCCHGAFFGFGFVTTILTLTVMFWIAWCYFGLTILQISDSQRRALVNYSYVSAKPLPTPTTAVPSKSVTVTTQETSFNLISKSPPTASDLRGSSRGESQVRVDKKKESTIITSLAKGDFADRDREAQKNATKIETPPPSKDASVTPSEREASKKKDAPLGATAAILSGEDVEESDERVYARRVLPSGAENRAEEKSQASDRTLRQSPSDLNPSRLEISPTKVYATDTAGGSSKVEDPFERPLREEGRTHLPRQDDIQSSRRPDSESVYREPEFDREYPKRYATSSDRGRYDDRDDDRDDERGSRGKYDKRERGRESDDRYSKGDTRVYPDDKVLDRKPTADEDRYRVRERYPDDIPRRGDDDRYDDRRRDYNEKLRTSDKDETRYRDRDIDRSPSRNDRYKDDDRYRYRDDDRLRERDDVKYTSRDEDRSRIRDDRPEDDRYRSRVDDRYRDRDDDRYRTRDGDRYRLRDDDRYRLRDDESYRSRDDDRYRYRDDERYRSRDDEKYRTRDDDRHRSDPDDRRSIPSRSSVAEDRYRSRSDDDKHIDAVKSRVRDADIRDPISRSGSALSTGDRKPTSSRSQYDTRVEEVITDYDVAERDRARLPVRDEVNPSRLTRLPYEEERYRNRDRDDRHRPTRYDDDEVKAITPTRTRIDSTLSRSSSIDLKIKDEVDSRYPDNSKDRITNNKFYEENERNSRTRIQDSRSAVSSSESSRRYDDDNDRYRTRLPNEKAENSKLNDRREEVYLDRRSYTSEEEGDYKRGASRTRDYYEDRSRSPTEDTRRRYRDDEKHSRQNPVADEEFERERQRDDRSRDRSKSRDRDDDEYTRYDDRYTSRDNDRYSSREERLSSPPRKYDTYPDDEERPRRRDSEIRTSRTDDSRIRDEIIRPSASSRDEERFYSRDDFTETKPPSRRRYDDDLPQSDEYDIKDRDSGSGRHSSGLRRPMSSREPSLGSSMASASSRDPSDVVIREKRYPMSDNRRQSSRVISNERSPIYPESHAKEEVRPLGPKDVIEAANRQSENSNQNSGQVHYPVFNPQQANLTSPGIIRPSERRGNTINARKRRSV